MKNSLSRWQSLAGLSLFCTLYLLLLVLFPSIVFHSLAYGNESKEKKRVLIIFPGQSDWPAYANTEQGIKSSLEAGTEFGIEYFIEYMDYYRNPEKIHNQLLVDLYHHTFSRTKIDLIIAHGTPTLEFVLGHIGERLQFSRHHLLNKHLNKHLHLLQNTFLHSIRHHYQSRNVLNFNGNHAPPVAIAKHA